MGHAIVEKDQARVPPTQTLKYTHSFCLKMAKVTSAQIHCLTQFTQPRQKFTSKDHETGKHRKGGEERNDCNNWVKILKSTIYTPKILTIILQFLQRNTSFLDVSLKKL